MTELFELLAPCHFGTESVLKKEITDLGYEIKATNDGKVFFAADAAGIARSNIFLRTTERVLLVVGRFKATTFDELFEKTKALPWERYIPEDGKFWVTKANSVKSKLFSPSDIQSIMKKAIVERLRQSYHKEWFLEDGASFPIRVSILKDEVTVGLDTSGESLHKRGYRKLTAKAPITETLAAALLLLTPWKEDRILIDPFCGSGTIPIEAAMIGANIAPGVNREFLAEDWEHLVPKKLWYNAVNEAEDLVKRNLSKHDLPMQIQGYDIDPEMVRAARQNASDAGVEEYIHFQQRAVKDLSHPKKYGFIITNPPYGERLEEKQALPALYREFGTAFAGLSDWSCFMITSYEDVQKYFGRTADKNRKIYNGMMKTYFYSFLGAKPPKRVMPEKKQHVT